MKSTSQTLLLAGVFLFALGALAFVHRREGTVYAYLGALLLTILIWFCGMKLLERGYQGLGAKPCQCQDHA